MVTVVKSDDGANWLVYSEHMHEYLGKLTKGPITGNWLAFDDDGLLLGLTPHTWVQAVEREYMRIARKDCVLVPRNPPWEILKDEGINQENWERLLKALEV